MVAAEANGGGSVRVVVHDFSGHPFQAQLARQLAREGHDVTHTYCSSFQTPKGAVGEDTSSGRYRSVGIALSKPFDKYSARRRALQEIEYAWRLTRHVARVRPEVVLTANSPLLSAWLFQIAMVLRRTPMVFWQQDVYSVAMQQHIASKGRGLGRIAGRGFVAIEKWLLRSSRRVVVISDDFLTTLRDWGIDPAKVTVIPNWAPLEEVPVRPRPNAWSERAGIGDTDTVFLYAGTLGLKHRPSVLLAVAEAFADRADVRVIVASEGFGATWLEENDEKGALEIIPFQPYADLPDMLGSADVVIVLLEPDAGTYSVPSKVLTYHCAGRPILGAMPQDNLATRIIESNGSGIVVTSGEEHDFVARALELAASPAEREEMGRAARAYAERTFDIDDITRRFVEVLDAARGATTASRPSQEDDATC